MRQRAPEPVEPPDHERVAVVEGGQGLRQAGPAHRRAGDAVVLEHAFTAGGGQSVTL